jgi:hypothetical protein
VVDNFLHGTLCDLSKEPRSAKIIYECGEVANELVYSVEEVSTCKYEIVVKTPKLCLDVPSIRIACHVEIPAPQQSSSSSNTKVTGSGSNMKEEESSSSTSSSSKKAQDQQSKSKLNEQNDPKIKILGSANLGRLTTTETADLLKLREKLAEELSKLTAKMVN